jgi:hypothetical protein
MSTSPPLTTNRLDRMYRQLAKIHAIITAQLAECACWRQTDSTCHLVRVGTSSPRPVSQRPRRGRHHHPSSTSHPRPHRDSGRDNSTSPRLIANPTQATQLR